MSWRIRSNKSDNRIRDDDIDGDDNDNDNGDDNDDDNGENVHFNLPYSLLFMASFFNC